MIRLLAAATLAIGIAASPAAAATYDAFTSFNGTQGAGGFTYGSFDGTSFTAFTGANGCASVIPGTTCLSNGGLPGVFKSNSGAFEQGSVNVPGDALLLHPGPNAGQTAVILFTAPTSGSYLLTYTATIADDSPSGVFLFGLQDNVLVNLAQLNGGNPFFTGSGCCFLAAGQQIGIGIDYDGSYFNDSIGVNVTFVGGAVPEPASWALLIAGFGLTGAAMRRRRVALTA